MQTKDFTTQHTVRYLSNKNNFSKQPLFLLTNNMGLTGDDFIAVYRITRGQGFTETFRESAAISDTGAANAISGDGVMGITIGSSNGLTSATGSNRIAANSITSAPGQTNTDWTAGVAATSSLLSTTSQGTEYIITMTMKGTDRVDVIVNDGESNATDITITGLPTLSDMKVIGNGVRPKGRQNSNYIVDATTDMNGAPGSADITTYLFNQQDAQEVWTSSGLTGVFDLSYNGLSAAVVGKAAGHGQMQVGGNMVSRQPGELVAGASAATVTGWTSGPIEGGFRLDNSSYLEGVTSSLFNTRDHATTGMTIMAYVRFHATGSEQSFVNICGGVNPVAGEQGASGPEGFRLYMAPGGNDSTQETGGAFCFSNRKSSITAGSLTTADGTVGKSTNSMAGAHNVLLNKWYHVAGVISATGSDSGMRIYVDGKRMILARTRSVDGVIDEINFPLSGTVSGSQDQGTASEANVIATPKMLSPRLLIGSDRANTDDPPIIPGAQVAHDLGITRVFNRPLSDSEVFQNFIGTIPSNFILSNFKIG